MSGRSRVPVQFEKCWAVPPEEANLVLVHGFPVLGSNVEEHRPFPVRLYSILLTSGEDVLVLVLAMCLRGLYDAPWRQ